MLVNSDSYDFYAMTMNYPFQMQLIHFINANSVFFSVIFFVLACLLLTTLTDARAFFWDPLFILFIKFYEIPICIAASYSYFMFTT